MIIAQPVVNITRLEKEIQKAVNEIGCNMLRDALEAYDHELMINRDTEKYRHRGKKQTVLKTVMGEVSYSRVSYEYTDEQGRNARIFLLDKALGQAVCGKISNLLAEKIAETSCENSFRKTSEVISSMTGQTISHTGAWNVVQSLGEHINLQEQENTKLAALNQGRGQHEVGLLFEEQDGIWINLQGKDRKERGSSVEMKVAIAYEGAKQTGKDRFNLSGKVACANFEGAADFRKRKEGAIAAYYNVDEINLRILNGDGANWIKSSLIDDTVHYQLDTFHRNKAILQQVSDPDARKFIFKLLYEKDIDTLLVVIDAYANSVAGTEDELKYRALLTYFKNNRDGLVLYKRRGLDLPEPPEGIVYRNCGAMESNIFSLTGRRMKRNRTNWSIKGGNNMARLLTLKSTGCLHRILSGFVSMVLPERYNQEIETTLSAARVQQRVGKGYDGFRQATIPSSQKWMKDIFVPKTIF